MFYKKVKLQRILPALSWEASLPVVLAGKYHYLSLELDQQ